MMMLSGFLITGILLNKMNLKNKIKSILLIFIILIVSTTVYAQVILPSEYYGIITINDKLILDDLVIEAYINETKVAEGFSVNGWYDIIVPADDKDTTIRRGGVENEIIAIKIDNYDIGNITWISGSINRKDFSITTTENISNLTETEEKENGEEKKDRDEKEKSTGKKTSQEKGETESKEPNIFNRITGLFTQDISRQTEKREPTGFTIMIFVILIGLVFILLILKLSKRK